MASTATVQARIVKNGGPKTHELYQAYYNAGTSATEDWARGELVFLDQTGVIARGDGTLTNGTFGTATALALDTANDAFATPRRWFITLEDHDSSAEGASVYVAVQEILSDTVLEVQLAATGATAPSQANVLNGQTYGGISEATGVWGLNVDDADATNGIMVVQDKDADTAWMVAETGAANTNGSGSYVRVKLVDTILI
jgi:hypothetical protein